MNKRVLFIASCMALVTTAMSFAIRGDILTDFEAQFVKPYSVEQASASNVTDQSELVKTSLGLIGTVAFFSFALTIFFGGPLVDLLGMGVLLRLAAACHIGGSLLTIFAPSYWVVVFATFVVGAGNGLVEAVCNPLIATIYPEEKTHKLTIFHAWFPGGIVIGGLLSYFLSQAFGSFVPVPAPETVGVSTERAAEMGWVMTNNVWTHFDVPDWLWQVKMALLLLPAVIYVVMLLGQEFPPTERVAAGLPFSEMFAEAVRRPLFIIVFLMMWLTAITELVPGAWISNIYNDVMGRKEGILALVWGSILMYVLRQFFSKPVHKLSPPVLIACTAPFAAAGLFLFEYASTPVMFFVAATLLYFGVCFWWPTMLGITSERCPRTGALGLAIIGGTGSFSTFVAGPVLGWLNDMYGPARCLQVWAILPVIITVVFLAVALSDRARGGYKVEKITD